MDTLSGNYRTEQSYEYDDLYQLIHVTGNTEYYPAISSVPDYKSTYTQDFVFDDKGLGNMMSKVSKETVSPLKVIGDNLNYNIGYVYDENYAHRLVQAGNRYYKYDANGNIICEQDGSFDDSENDVSYYKVEQHSEDVYSTDNGWGLFKDESGEGRGQTHRYRRTYTWNSRNQLVSSVDANYSTSYVYGQDGQRSNKYTQGSETLYFNKMWTLHTDNGNSVYGGQYAKNVYLGETRIVTKLARADQKTAHEEMYKQYYYHSDHLGSATMISDWEGKEYQRIEYTPYGETWVEKTNNSGSEFLPYKFTGKEVDQETGLYYYGARYLDPKYSMWISTDPALGEYIPEMGKGNAKDSGSLLGMGGVYNHINFHLYHYAGNNPVRFVDPDGNETMPHEIKQRYDAYINAFQLKTDLIKGHINSEVFFNSNSKYAFKQTYFNYPVISSSFSKSACFATALLNVVAAQYKKETGNSLSFIQACKAMDAAIQSKNIDPQNARILDIEAAVNTMAKSVGLKGKFKYTTSRDADYVIFNLEKCTHFVNALDPNDELLPYFDTFWGTQNNVYSKDDENKLILNRPLNDEKAYRGFNYEQKQN